MLRNLFALSILVLVGCGGGGGGGDLSNLTSSDGSVAVLLRDGPLATHDSIFVMVDEVSIRSVEGDWLTIYQSAEGFEFDLLDLDNEDLVLAVEDNVPPGSYDLIRLGVIDVSTEGGPCDTLDIMVPSGRVQVRLDSALVVESGRLSSLRIDVDVSRSLHVAGNSGKCIFRPLLRAEVGSGSFDDRCVSALSGEISQITSDGSGQITELVLDLGDQRGTIDIMVPAGTGLFDGTSQPIAQTTLVAGDAIEVMGRLNDDGDLVADVLAFGPTTVISGVVTDNMTTAIDVELDPGQSATAAVELFDETSILVECEDASVTDLVAGLEVEVRGTIDLSASVLRAVQVEAQSPSIAGFLTLFIEDGAGGFQASVNTESDGSGVSSDFEIDAALPLLVSGTQLALDGTFLEDQVECEARTVEFRFSPGNSATATAVTIFPERFEGVVDAEVDSDDQLTVLVDEDGDGVATAVVFELLPGAELVMIDGIQSPIEAADIEVGDRVEVFGLQDCTMAAADVFVAAISVIDDDGDDDDDEGCGIGYWKQPQHFDSYPDGYSSTTLFSDVFTADVFDGLTLVEVLRQGGGGLNALGRHAVAAVLNAASSEVDYAYTVSEVVSLFDQAVDRDEDDGQDDDDDHYDDDDDDDDDAIEDLKEDFEDANEAGCPLS